MGNWHRYAVATAVYMLLIVILMIGRSECSRDLQPSEHGLSYQSNATVAAAAGDNSPETKSFFRGTTSAATASIPFPEEKNGTSDASWRRGVSGGGGGRRRDHVKDALVVASVMCGATGVVLHRFNLSAACLTSSLPSIQLRAALWYRLMHDIGMEILFKILQELILR